MLEKTIATASGAVRPVLEKAEKTIQSRAQTIRLQNKGDRPSRKASNGLRKKERLNQAQQIIKGLENAGNFAGLPPFPRQAEGSAPLPRMQKACAFGLDEIDGACFSPGLEAAALHHITAINHAHRLAALGFCLALLNRFAAGISGTPPEQTPRTKILWAQSQKHLWEFGFPFGQGLMKQGLDPSCCIFVTGARDTDILWAMEEGLNSGALLAVIGEVDTPSFTATRRLALAAGATQTPGFLLQSLPAPPSQNKQENLAGMGAGTSAAASRWRISARPGTPNPWDEKAPGNRNWHLELVRNRGGRPGSFNLEWNRETHTFRLAAKPGSRPPQTAPQSPRPDPGGTRGTDAILQWTKSA